ncbi:MAG: hypothetical protein AYL28_004450 [Candidatus Bathyarchaeota archaeon B23]|nr:MAG: hypothetical protein AYL28_004450 [Candidatus Bathyarchaeota archaeon B23]
MRVRVLIFGEAASRLGRSLDLELDEDATVRSLMGLLAGRVGRPLRVDDGLTVLVNGRNIALLDGLETRLRDGDLVVLLPPLSGG